MQPVRLAAMIAAALVSATALTACNGHSTPSAAPAATQSVYTPPPCPTPSVKPKPPKWPVSLPADIPKPADATILKQDGVTTTPDGVHIVRYLTPSSLRDSVIFIVQKYPKAGYVLGRGDAEATEADAPFIHGQIRGVTRISSIDNCQTLWLTATVNVNSVAGGSGGTPLLPPHATPSPSPLPFG